MRCYGCGFSLTVEDVPRDKRCNACGGAFSFESDDLLLRQYGAPGRDIRTGQVEMGRLVERVIRENAIAFIEAPVGSGKSDAYGVPAMISALPGKVLDIKQLGNNVPSKIKDMPKPFRRIVIATAKKNLQHQIAERDLPFLRSRFGADLKIALLKGKNNYACPVKARSLDKKDAEQFTKWYSRSDVGDLWDYPGPFVVKMNITAEDCIGRDCPMARKGNDDKIPCGYWRSRVEAHDSSLIVTNHHVVAFDLRFGPCTVLGPYTTLILDEAHQAPSSFRAAFSNTITQSGYTALIRQMDRVSIATRAPGLDDKLKAAWATMFMKIAFVEGEIPANPFGAEGDAAIDVLDDIKDETNALLEAAGYSEAKKSGSSFGDEDRYNPFRHVSDSNRDRVSDLLALKKGVSRTIETLARAKVPGDNTVLYVSMSDKMQVRLTLAPISVGPIVGPKLQMIPSVVFTSATIAVNDKFDDIKHQVGLNWASYTDEDGGEQEPKKIYELILPTPFNYDKQALLYTPRHIPLPAGGTSPERAKYILSLVNECTRLIRASGGNAFVLFTSKQDLKDVHAGLEEEDLPFPLFIQEDDASTTLQQFMETPQSVLLGVKSFWEGVDVPGQKLQLVIITKLPFPALTDPVLQARSRLLVAEQVAQGISPTTAQSGVFSQLQIPHMLTELRQGAGRLIRSKTDKGVLAILDTRMFTGNSRDKPAPTQTDYRGYGRLVANATGFRNHVFDFEVIQRVFAQWNARHAATKKSSTTPGEAAVTSGSSARDAG